MRHLFGNRDPIRPPALQTRPAVKVCFKMSARKIIRLPTVDLEPCSCAVLPTRLGEGRGRVGVGSGSRDALARRVSVTGDGADDRRRQAQLPPLHLALPVHPSRSVLLADEDHSGPEAAAGGLGYAGGLVWSCLVSRVSCLLSLVSCLLSLVSCLLSLVSCLLSLVSCLLSLVSCLVSLVSCLLSLVSCLMSLVSCLLSLVSCLLSLVSRSGPVRSVPVIINNTHISTSVYAMISVRVVIMMPH